MEAKTPDKITRYQKHFSERGFWEKVGDVAKKAGSKVIYAALLLYYVLIDENTPLKYKGIIIGSLGYFILPLDIIPDFIPIAGYTDDLAALTACIKAVWECITPEIKVRAEKKLSEWFDS